MNVIIGSYTGNGGDSANKQTINIWKKPRAVFLQGEHKSTFCSYNGRIITNFLFTEATNWEGFSFTNNGFAVGNIEKDGYGPNYINSENKTYTYIAFV